VLVDSGIKYIPHPCAIDGLGKILMNYNGGMAKAIEVAAAAAGQEVPKELASSGCVLL